MIKPDTVNSRVATTCGQCDAVDQLLIHHVRYRGAFRRLCTSCVLREHRHSFCPTCFQVYPPAPSADDAATCGNCHSSSHSRCVASGPTLPPSPYICPLCVSHNSPIFKLKTAKEANLKTGEGLSEGCRVMDRDSAKILLAATKIASLSMNRAAVAAKEEADRRAREASVARKRAKEALEHVAYLVMKEKMRKKETGLAVPGGGNVGYAAAGFNRARVENGNGNANVCGGNRNGIAGPSVVRMEQEKIDTAVVGNVGCVDNSNQVLAAALNAVELRENGKAMGGVAANNDEAVMDEHDEKGAKENVEEFIAERNNGSGDHNGKFAAEMETDNEEYLDVLSGPKQDDDAVSVQTEPNQADCKENGNNGEQHANSH